MRKRWVFENRDISWLKFNARVIAEGRNPRNPPLERARFLSIAATNLDAFFMVRVGKLGRKARTGKPRQDRSSRAAFHLLKKIHRLAQAQTHELYNAYRTELLPLLAEHGIALLQPEQLTGAQHLWLASFFEKYILPVLTPRILHPSRPFPLLAARSITLVFCLRAPASTPPVLGILPVPSGLGRVIFLPMDAGKARGVLLEDAISFFADRLFSPFSSLSVFPLRITRHTDVPVSVEHRDMIADATGRSLRKRSSGRVTRLEALKAHSLPLLRRLRGLLKLGKPLLVRCEGPLDLGFLAREVYALEGFDALRYASFKPRIPPLLAANESIFRTIAKRDLFFYHPYDSFEPVLRLIREAASDPQVLAIKQTLYRISSESPFIPLLAQAARNGKQVTVLIEVRARFDEESNLAWSRVLEKAGCHVLYGVPAWKTHSKITLVVRREAEGLSRYVHVGTGNYNDSTAKTYTDMGIMTCDRDMGEDAGSFFNMITGYSLTSPLKCLIVAPFSMRSRLLSLIDRERQHALSGLPARIAIKVNSLSDRKTIASLYLAAEAGVHIHLLVRGICCARPDVDGRLVIRSIVGRFLEHTRVFIFENAGDREVFLSSADLMPRNLDRRIELAAPVKDAALRDRIVRTIELEFSDNQKSWELNTQGEYTRRRSDGKELNSQEILLCKNPWPP